MAMKWAGVFPAVTTQFDEQLRVDLAATARVIDGLVRDGVDGLIVCGTVGEGTSLTGDEKRAVLEAAVGAAKRRVPVVAGVAEYTTQMAADLARDAERLGVNGLMVMPAMVYAAKPRETVAHFRGVARASSLPIMLYNNPLIYRTDVTPQMVGALTDVDTIVAVKDSGGHTSRYVDLRNAVGDRFALFCGLDDVILESVLLGCVGWVSGMSNVFPREGNRLFGLAREGRWAEANALYRWFMPLLHLDARPDLVQCIKLCEQIVGRGSERVRPPRLPLEGAERHVVEKAMKDALGQRPNLDRAA
jgi:4-hydroxy-tetrahydrodipicolinate synthase